VKGGRARSATIEALHAFADYSFVLDLSAAHGRFLAAVALSAARGAGLAGVADYLAVRLLNVGVVALDRVSEVARNYRAAAVALAERLEDDGAAVHLWPPHHWPPFKGSK